MSELADDMLYGAEAIAGFLFGKNTGRERRQVYHLVSAKIMPVFRLGTQLCARKSSLIQWIENLENEATTNSVPQQPMTGSQFLDLFNSMKS